MIWAKRTVDAVESDEIFDKFEARYLVQGAPEGWLLASSRSADEYYLRVADRAALDAFSGFQEVDGDQLPETATLLIGRESDFFTHFRRQQVGEL